MDKEEQGDNKGSTGGYDLDFVNSIPERLICSICTHILRDPHLMICCGKKCCISCLLQNFKMRNLESCPYCRRNVEDVNPLHVLEKELKSEIGSSLIYCTNKMKGCDWTGELRNLSNHLTKSTGCQYFEQECPSKCESEAGKVTRILRKNVHEHVTSSCELRLVRCQYCTATVTVKSSSSHKMACPKFPLQCPNECGMSNIERQMLEKHREVCMHERVECPNSCGLAGLLRMMVHKHRQDCKLEIVTCPNNCRKTGITRETLSLHRQSCKFESIRCPNGCNDTGIIRHTLQPHRLRCPLEPVQCVNVKLGCKELVLRQNLKQHVLNDCHYRQVSCQYCTSICIAKLLPEHEKMCELFPVKCPKGCKLKVTRQHLDSHWQECDFEPVQCKFADVGCSAVVERIQMSRHYKEKTEEHLKLVSDALEGATDKVCKYRQKLLEKDLELQQKQAMLNKRDADLDKTTAELHQIKQAHKILKTEVSHTEKVIRKEIQIYNSNDPIKHTPEYSYVRNQTRAATKSANPYSYIMEQSPCVNHDCLSHRLRCSFFIESIEAQFHGKRPLSGKPLYFRMIGFNKISINSGTWSSPTFILDDSLEIYMEVCFQKDQTFMNVRVCLKQDTYIDESTVGNRKLNIELIEADDVLKPDIQKLQELHAAERILMEIDVGKLLALKYLNVKTIMYASESWKKRFDMQDSILWAVTSS